MGEECRYDGRRHSETDRSSIKLVHCKNNNAQPLDNMIEPNNRLFLKSF